MNSKHAVYSLFLFLLISTVIAAGGGGGGGGGGGSGGGSSGGGGTDPFFDSLECDDRGVISFMKKPRFKTVTVERSDNGSVLENIAGNWNGFSFVSDEAVILTKGTYVIKDAKQGERTVECPGLRFSCKLVELDIQECMSEEGEIKARFTIDHANTRDLKIQFKTDDGTLIAHQKGSISSELKTLTLRPIDGQTYEIQVKNVPSVSTIEISHPDCVGGYYVYSTMACGAPGETESEPQQGETLKCGGYLDIQDRVACRISLREDKKDEYQNFYPEECKARDDKKQCLDVYRAVQQCWAFPNGVGRIACVKEQLELGDIAIEKQTCAEKTGEEQQECMSELRGKVYDLIKFRLYNLEEEAEHFMEQGKLTKEDVTQFVVQMETNKLAFNRATSKAERATIITRSRQHWRSLITKMEPET